VSRRRLSLGAALGAIGVVYGDIGTSPLYAFEQSLDATGKEVLTFAREWQRRTPIFIAPTRMPQINKVEFFNAGISHTMFANQGLRAAHLAMDTSGVGLRLRARWRHIGSGHVTADFSALRLSTSQGPDRSC